MASVLQNRDQPLSIFALSNNPRLDLPEIVDATAATFR
jgi:hypothetical protein